MRILALVLLNLTLWTLPVQAQLWSGIIDPARAMDWTQTGAGTIPPRLTICSTLNPGATVAQINSAIAACPSGQTVFLSAGTYSLSGTINLQTNVTLRGAGSNATFLNFTAVSGDCNTGGDHAICMGTNSGWWGQPANSASWTAGYAKGTSVITLSTTSNLAVGGVLLLDQIDDPSDTGGIYINEISLEGGSLCRDKNTSVARCYIHAAHVIAINGSQITISPPLLHNLWGAGHTPGAWWPTGAKHGMGLENLRVNTGSVTATSNIAMWNSWGSWVKNVASIVTLGVGSGRNHIFIAQGGSNTVRDSYFFGSKNGAALSYGVESNIGGFNLIENNMFNEVVSPILPGSAMGDVYAYNYSINHNRSDNPGWNMPGPVWAHDAGDMFNLSEGNSGTGTVMDNIHGTIHLNTFFRNHYRGRDGTKTQNTQVMEISRYARFMNVVGNVIGEPGYHTIYESIGPSGPNCSLTIFILNWQGTGCQGVTDARVSASLMRWGNYDVVNNAVRFVSAEVPSGDAFRPNPVPASQVLPNSFYLSAQPNAWWTTPWGTPHWPPVGPDVTGGTVTSGSGVASTLGGHVYKIPARLCYENTSSTGLVKNFDGAVCYPASSGNTTPPAPPTGLKIQ